MICVSLGEPSLNQARRLMHQAATRADLVEVRLDQLDALPDAAGLAELLRDRPCPVIATARPPALGGRNDWPDDVRLKILQAAAELGADYVDVEYELARRIARRPNTRVIASYHNFTSTPLDLPNIYTQIAQSGGDIVKLATTANSILDNLRLFDVLRHAAIPCIGLCMGELGLISRILGRKFGSMLTYSPLTPDKATAPGQILLDDLIGLYRYRAINPDTRVYGLIANPVAHSISPHVHNAAFRALGINAVYVPFRVENDVRNFVDACRGLPVYGYSVTTPHKEAAMAAADEVDPICRQIGALNTVVNRKGRLVGSNTDWTAAVEALERALSGASLAGRRVALLGAGGTARAIAFGLKAKGAIVCVHNRTPARAQKLARDVACEWAGLDDLETLDADIVINATSVGMYPNVDATPLPASLLEPRMIVFDTVYNPVSTRLLLDAEEVGCATLNGLDMFVGQAAQQFKTWTGLDAPRELMQAIAAERLSGA